jgi:peptidoglycan/xylan/chitin deacetylase (PgdA/CDA1 family)
MFLSSLSFGQDYGQLSVKKWADNRTSAFTFSFDDGVMSHYDNVRPILNSFGFNGTFFLVSSLLTDDLPGIQRYGTWNQFRTMALEGHEMGSHTVTHHDLTTLPLGDSLTPLTLVYELSQSMDTIEYKIPSQKCITLAYPSLAYDSLVISVAQQYYQSARRGTDFANNPTFTDSEFFRVRAKEELFSTPRVTTNDDLDELADFENFVQGSITVGKWGILEGHEVVPFTEIPTLVQNGEWYPMSNEWLTALCQWLKPRSDDYEIWVETMGNITRYIRERQYCKYNVNKQTADQLKINVTDTLDDNIYNYPLTVDITVPPDWNAAVVTQGSVIDTVNTFIINGINYARAHVIPNGGILTLDLSDIILPVELTSFSATVISDGIHLKWMTSNEINSSQFSVEWKSADKPWETLGSLPGSGNSNSTKVYSFIDKTHQSNGKYSFRLKMIDNDGQFKYSKILDVEVTNLPVKFALKQNYPNPFNPSTKIHYEVSSKQLVTLKVYDMLGKEIDSLVNEEKASGTYELIWNANNVASGVYYYRMQAGNFVETKKMVLLK